MTPELFYVLDLGDALAEGPLSHVLQPTLANAVGHVISFAMNGLLWIGLVAFGAWVI